MKILLIEDEKALAESISDYLKGEGYVCELAKDFYAAEEKVGLYQYDCVLVDITLPGGSGLDLVKQIKKLKTNAGVKVCNGTQRSGTCMETDGKRKEISGVVC